MDLPVELRQLRYFVAVAEELHFGRAAERLNMSQSPLSRAIRELERELGVVLFIRTTRRVELTPAGSALLERARLALAEVDLAVRGLARGARDPQLNGNTASPQNGGRGRDRSPLTPRRPPMSTSEPSSQQPLHANEPYTATDRVEEVAADVGLAGALSLRGVEVGVMVLVGLLVCPPLAILVVVVVVPLVAVAVLVSLVAAVLAVPYLIVSHVRGQHGGHAVLRHRLGRALHALWEIAPHRLLAAIRRGHLAR